MRRRQHKRWTSGLRRLIPCCAALALLPGCQPRGPEAQYVNYLTKLGRTLSAEVPAIRHPALPGPPGTGQLRLDIPSGSLDTLDFLALSGCAVQVTIGKRNSSLGRMARDSQRLLLDLEYLHLAPQCIAHLRDKNADTEAAILEQSRALKQQQLPALIFNATLGGAQYRSFWMPPQARGGYPQVSGSLVVSALESINGHARRWLAGDFRADNRAFEILLSEVAGGDGGALLQGPGGSYHALLPPVAALEEQLDAVLPLDYRAWMSQRNRRLTAMAAAPSRPVEQRNAKAPGNWLH